jgi:hypothetical protein
LEGDGLGVDDLVGVGFGVGVGDGVRVGVADVSVLGVPVAAGFDEPPVHATSVNSRTKIPAIRRRLTLPL